jgi:hypothetical protein
VKTPIIRNGRFADDVDRGSVIDGFDRRIARTTAESAAEVILKQLPRGRAQILVGRDAQLLGAASRVLGGSYQRLVPWLLARRGAGVASQPPPTKGVNDGRAMVADRDVRR